MIMKIGKYTVVDNSGTLHFSGNDLKEAKNQAEQWCKITGKKAHILQAIETVEVAKPPILWGKFKPEADNLPTGNEDGQGQGQTKSEIKDIIKIVEEGNRAFCKVYLKGGTDIICPSFKLLAWQQIYKTKAHPKQCLVCAGISGSIIISHFV